MGPPAEKWKLVYHQLCIVPRGIRWCVVVEQSGSYHNVAIVFKCTFKAVGENRVQIGETWFITMEVVIYKLFWLRPLFCVLVVDDKLYDNKIVFTLTLSIPDIVVIQSRF